MYKYVSKLFKIIVQCDQCQFCY